MHVALCFSTARVAYHELRAIPCSWAASCRVDTGVESGSRGYRSSARLARETDATYARKGYTDVGEPNDASRFFGCFGRALRRRARRSPLRGIHDGEYRESTLTAAVARRTRVDVTL